MENTNTELPGIDLDKLEALAKAATPGRWMRLFGERTIYDRMEDGCRGNAIVRADIGYSATDANNLDFIAASNPVTMLQLIALARSAITQQAEAPQACAADTTVSASGGRATDYIMAAVEDYASNREASTLARIRHMVAEGQNAIAAALDAAGRATPAPVAAQQAAAEQHDAVECDSALRAEPAGQHDAKLQAAIQWLNTAPHGDNCFVSDHYPGDPGNRCNCGKDSLLQHLESDEDKQ